MLTNKELSTITKTIALLNIILKYALSTESHEFFEKTGITVMDIDTCIHKLHHIAVSHHWKKHIQSEKSNEYNKTHKEYHRITNNMHESKKNGNMERYNYWKRKRDELKKKGGE